jgi:hypothetical protein
MDARRLVMIYHEESKTVIVTPTRCGSVTLHKALCGHNSFVKLITTENNEHTIHGTYESINRSSLDIRRNILLIRNPFDRMLSIFNSQNYNDVDELLCNFNIKSRTFKPCSEYLDIIDDIIRIENAADDIKSLFDIDIDQFESLYENSSSYDISFDIDDLRSIKTLVATKYYKDMKIGRYEIG